MASQNFTVTGTTHATATAISGLTDDKEYKFQNKTGVLLNIMSKATQPTDEEPATFAPYAWGTIITESGESYWVWVEGPSATPGPIYIEEVGDA